MLSQFRNTIEKLAEVYNRREAEQIVLLLLEKITQMSRVQLMTHPVQLNASELNTLFGWFDRLLKLEPVQYVLGEAEFFGLPFKVTPDVLIPRPETEELVEWVLEDWRDHSNLSVIDVGTGSGCIPISLKKHLVDATVSAVDISAKALEVAKKNAQQNNQEVNFIEDNILEPAAFYGKFDVIISNPPYVPLSDKHAMQVQVKQHEPLLALFVADEDPLIFYRKIAQFAQNHLQPNGRLYFETHFQLGHEVKLLLESMNFTRLVVRKDLSGNDRMVCAELYR